MPPTLSYFSDGVTFRLRDQRKCSEWLIKLASKHRRQISSLNYVFVSDNQLLKINKQYLKHDTYTDIITFDLSDGSRNIEGEIYISIDRVKDNAARYKSSMKTELHRVMAHGLLHLIGFKDKTAKEATEMRKQEQIALDLRTLK